MTVRVTGFVGADGAGFRFQAAKPTMAQAAKAAVAQTSLFCQVVRGAPAAAMAAPACDHGQRVSAHLFLADLVAEPLGLVDAYDHRSGPHPVLLLPLAAAVNGGASAARQTAACHR